MKAEVELVAMLICGYCGTELARHAKAYGETETPTECEACETEIGDVAPQIAIRPTEVDI